MLRSVLLYGAALAVGTIVLEWLNYQHLARMQAVDIYVFLIAAAFLALGIYIGVRVIGGAASPVPFDGNPAARATLGISERELAVLERIAAGRSNVEIAQDLSVSPNTVKTHVARLYEKLEAKRRTDAINKARDLGIVR